jgi:hypothetical protein
MGGRVSVAGLSHGLESGPVGFSIEPVELGAEGVALNLNAAMIFLEGFRDRQAATGQLGIQPELALTAIRWWRLS